MFDLGRSERARLDVSIWTAGGSNLGFGHLRRCWTLAEQLESRGATARLFVPSAEAGEALGPSRFSVEVSTLEQFLTAMTTSRDRSARVIVVDDPRARPEFLEALTHVAPVACVDDVCDRLYPVDLVVNGSAGAERLPYSGLPRTRYLLGPNFILLRREFAALPDRANVANPVRRVLILTGGGDAGSTSWRVAGAVVAVIPNVAVDLVVGPFGRRLAAADSRVTLHQNPSNLRALMLAADLAVSGGGQTAYEVAATATPALGLRLAENQRVNLAGLSGAGCLLDVGAPEDVEFDQRLGDSLNDLSNDPQRRDEMGRAGRRLVDGRGAERVASFLVARLAGKEQVTEGYVPR